MVGRPPFRYVSVNSIEAVWRVSTCSRFGNVSIWIRVFRRRLCVWIVPRNVASGDLSDSADSGITHLRVLNSGKGSPPPGTSLKQTSNQRFTKTQIRLCLNCAQVSPLPASKYGGLSWEFNRATAGSTHRTSLSIPLERFPDRSARFLHAGRVATSRNSQLRGAACLMPEFGCCQWPMLD